MSRIRGVIFAATFAGALAAAMGAPASAAGGTAVKVDSGSVQGVESSGVISFKGIPYAAPPVGDLRWRDPQPVEPWKTTLDAADFGPACMQTDDIAKSEDCLTLNVWRPVKKGLRPLPVMVWIYGGALAHGNTAMYLGDALAKQGVIMVSMNYRVGRFGFFAFPALADEAPNDLIGNYGYFDQLAALKWVQRNIAAFGGDPKQVTIFGESAGGGSVMVHLTSPLSKGLFARAILQSPGVPTARSESLPLSSLANAQSSAVDYAKSVGITGTDAAALKQLRGLSTDDLLADVSAQQVVAGLGSGHLPLGFPTSILDGKLVAQTPDAAFAAGNWNKVPVIVGANSRDLDVGAAATKDDLFALFGAKADDARKLYDPDGSMTFEELKQQVLADKTLVEPARHLADEVAASGEPVWLYRFSYVATAQRAQLPGTLHGFEIPYTMDLPAAIVGNKVTDDDKKMGVLASAYRVSFAKSGDPNGGGRPQWPKYDPKANDAVFNFGNAGTGVGADALKARLDLWASIYDAN